MALFAAIVVMCAGCDWQMFGYGPEHTSFNPTESAISVGNVTGLVRRYPANNAQGCGRSPDPGGKCSSPVVAKGSAFSEPLAAISSRVMSAAAACGGAPLSARLFRRPRLLTVSSISGASASLYAFDAAGNTNCSGSPKTCAPLWTADTTFEVTTPPTVAGGVVYVGTDYDKVFAFSAAGTTGCSGSPKVCTPLWSATLSSGVSTAPAVANGVVYFSAGTSSTRSTPAVRPTVPGAPRSACRYGLGTRARARGGAPPAVANGVVYVGAGDKRSDRLQRRRNHELFRKSQGLPSTLDRAVVRRCRECAGDCQRRGLHQRSRWFPFNPSDQGLLYAFDAAGITHCSGSPKKRVLRCGPPRSTGCMGRRRRQ